MQFDFSGKDLIVRFDENTQNNGTVSGVRGYRFRYVLANGEIIHNIDQANFQAEDEDEIRSYQDTLSFEDIVSKGKTRNIQVFARTEFSDGLPSLEAEFTARNPAPAVPVLRTGLGDTFLNLTFDGASDDTDFAGYIVWADTDPNATYDTAASKAKGAGANVTLDVEPDTLYYVQYAAYDVYGTDQLNIGKVTLKSLSADSNVIPLIEEAIRNIEDQLVDYKEDFAELVLLQGTAADKVTRAFRDDAFAVTNHLNQRIEDQNTNVIEQIQGVSVAFDDRLATLDGTVVPRIQAAVQQESTVRANQFEAVANQLNLIGARIDGNVAAIFQEAKTRADGDKAEAELRNQLQVRVGTAEGRITSLSNTIAGFTYAETTTVTQQLSQLGDSIRGLISSTNTTRVDAENALARRIDETVANIGAANTRITSVVDAQASANVALGKRIDQVVSSVGNVDARVINSINTQAGVNQSLAQQIQQVQANVGGVDSRVTQVQNAQAGTNYALGQRIDAVQASLNGINFNGIYAAIAEERNARVAEDQANANFTSQVKARLDNMNGATIEQQFNAIAQDNGTIKSSYTVKTEVLSNGRRVVGGFGLLNDGNSTEFAIKADRFIVSNGATERYPFQVIGDTVRMSNIEVDTVKANTIYATHINPGEVTGVQSFTSYDVYIPRQAYEITLIETPYFSLGDPTYGVGVAVVSFLQDGTLRVDSGVTLRAYVDEGAGYQLRRQQNQGVRTDGGNTYWAIPCAFPLALNSSTNTRIKVTATCMKFSGGGWNDSYMRSIECDVFRGTR